MEDQNRDLEEQKWNYDDGEGKNRKIMEEEDDADFGSEMDYSRDMSRISVDTSQHARKVVKVLKGGHK